MANIKVAEEHKEKGNGFFSKGEFQEAIKWYTKVRTSTRADGWEVWLTR